MFEKASRRKLRFQTPKGTLNVEDLWDLPLTAAPGRANLDAIAIDLHHQTSAAPVSFVNASAGGDDNAALAFAIVKHVIRVRQEEAAAAAGAKARADERQRLLAILDRRETADLEQLSADDLRARIAAL